MSFVSGQRSAVSNQQKRLGREEATRELLSELVAFVEKNGDASIKQFIEDHKSELDDGE